MSADVTANRIERLKDAVEGECEGLAITDAQAAAILNHVDHAADALDAEVEEIVGRYAAAIKANAREIVGMPDEAVRAHLREFLGAAGLLFAASPAHATVAMREAIQMAADIARDVQVCWEAPDGWSINELTGMVLACQIEALSSPAQEGEAAPVRTDADGVREAIARRLEQEADMLPCEEDAQVTRSNAMLIRANFSYDDAERLSARKPEGETGPAVAEPVAWQWRMDAGCKWDFIDDPQWYRERGGEVRALYPAALTVSPSPSERNQHQGETLRDHSENLFGYGMLAAKLMNRADEFKSLRGNLLMYGIGHAETDRAASEALLQSGRTIEALLRRLSTPEAVPVEDKPPTLSRYQLDEDR